MNIDRGITSLIEFNRIIIHVYYRLITITIFTAKFEFSFDSAWIRKKKKKNERSKERINLEPSLEVFDSQLRYRCRGFLRTYTLIVEAFQNQFSKKIYGSPSITHSKEDHSSLMTLPLERRYILILDRSIVAPLLSAFSLHFRYLCSAFDIFHEYIARIMIYSSLSPFQPNGKEFELFRFRVRIWWCPKRSLKKRFLTDTLLFKLLANQFSKGLIKANIRSNESNRDEQMEKMKIREKSRISRVVNSLSLFLSLVDQFHGF